MAIADIVTLGFGSGGVAFVPTLGFSAGAAVEPEPSTDPRVLDALYLAGLTTPAALRLTGLTTPAALALTGLTTLPALILEGDD